MKTAILKIQFLFMFSLILSTPGLANELELLIPYNDKHFIPNIAVAIDSSGSAWHQAPVKVGSTQEIFNDDHFMGKKFYKALLVDNDWEFEEIDIDLIESTEEVTGDFDGEDGNNDISLRIFIDSDDNDIKKVEYGVNSWSTIRTFSAFKSGIVSPLDAGQADANNYVSNANQIVNTVRNNLDTVNSSNSATRMDAIGRKQAFIFDSGDYDLAAGAPSHGGKRLVILLGTMILLNNQIIVDFMQDAIRKSSDKGGANIAIIGFGNTSESDTDGFGGIPWLAFKSTVDQGQANSIANAFRNRFREQNFIQFPEDHDWSWSPLDPFDEIPNIAQKAFPQLAKVATPPWLHILFPPLENPSFQWVPSDGSTSCCSPVTTLHLTAYEMFQGGDPANHFTDDYIDETNIYENMEYANVLNTLTTGYPYGLSGPRAGRIDRDAFTNGRRDGPYVPHLSRDDVCGPNHLVTITDFKATGDKFEHTEILDVIQDLTGSRPSNPNFEVNYSMGQSLLDEFTEALYLNDVNPHQPGFQNITTHFVDTDPDHDSHSDAIQYAWEFGGGKQLYTLHNYDPASITVMDDIIDEATDSKPRLPAYKLTIPTDPLNPFQQGNEVIVSFFDGKKGNIRKYRITNGVIVNKNGQPVFHSRGSVDFDNVGQGLWSDDTDLPIYSGGVAGTFDYNGTNRYVMRSENSKVIELDDNGNAPPASLTKNAFFPDGSGTQDELADVKKIIRGVDPEPNEDGDTVPYRFFGDALNASPKVFYYRRGSSPVARIFSANNMGFVHNFDLESGQEKWGLILREFLPRVGDFYRTGDSLDIDNKEYGFDGHIEILHNDLNNDFDLMNGGVIDTVDGVKETATLLVTARRGGKYLIGLDIANENRLDDNKNWLISEQTPGFSGIGDTWSKPVIGYLNAESDPTGKQEPVIFLGGGYDDQYDNPGFTGAARWGNSIYIIKPDGTKHWSAGNGGDEQVLEMQYPIVGNIETIDLDNNGSVDLFYAADLMGQVFRCEIELPTGQGLPGNDQINCALFADLGRSGQRFYASLDAVPIISKRGGITHIALSIGSGNLTTPSEAGIINSFYTVFDQLDSEQPSTLITRNDLMQLTIGSNQEYSLTSDKPGWYVNFNAGEKVWTSSKTFFNNLNFKTFYKANSVPIPERCTPVSAYAGRSYLVNIISGNLVGNPQDISLQSGLPTLGTTKIRYSEQNGKFSSNVSIQNDGGQNNTVTLPEFPSTLRSFYTDDDQE